MIKKFTIEGSVNTSIASNSPPKSGKRLHSETNDSTPCHCCKQPLHSNNVVRCQNQTCKAGYCRPCLVQRYKYAKKAVKKLPSSIWQCPKCKRKCFCDE